jgi:hypothetical protein
LLLKGIADFDWSNGRSIWGTIMGLKPSYNMTMLSFHAFFPVIAYLEFAREYSEPTFLFSLFHRVVLCRVDSANESPMNCEELLITQAQVRDIDVMGFIGCHKEGQS